MIRKTPLKYVAWILAGSLYLVTHAASADSTRVYKWVDEKGNVQYTQQQPPADKAKSSVSIPVISTSPSAAAPTSATNTSLPNSATSGSPSPTISEKDKAEHLELLKKNCDAAHNNLKTLEANKLVVVEGEDGKARALSAEEHKAQLDKAKKDIEIFCQAAGQKEDTSSVEKPKAEEQAKTDKAKKE